MPSPHRPASTAPCTRASGTRAPVYCRWKRTSIGRPTREDDRAWRERIEKEVEEWWRVVEDRAKLPGDPMNPQLVAHELSERLPDDCILTADSGSSTNWWARHVKLRKGMRSSLSGNLATMGPAAPYAIAAKFAHPEKPVIGV